MSMARVSLWPRIVCVLVECNICAVCFFSNSHLNCIHHDLVCVYTPVAEQGVKMDEEVKVEPLPAEPMEVLYCTAGCPLPHPG